MKNNIIIAGFPEDGKALFHIYCPKNMGISMSAWIRTLPDLKSAF